MKKFCCLFIFIIIFSCKGDDKRWEVSVMQQNIEAKIIDISADIYNTDIPFDTLKTKYYFLFDPNVSDEIYEKQRTDSLELLLYSDIKEKFDLTKLESELNVMFNHIQYYYPKFETPTVYVLSSVFSEEYKFKPVQYFTEYNTFIIALDFFLGTDNDYYKVFKVENYLRESMNPENVVPKTSMAIAETLPLMDERNNQFMNYLVTFGKVMLLQDAFLPGYSDALKIGYTQKQIDWCYANERNMWNYFIQENYLFSDEKDLYRRFLQTAPFSKFFILNESNESVDLESPGAVGKWIGWQIVRKYAEEKPDVSLMEIMANRNFQQIFNDSHYQPK